MTDALARAVEQDHVGELVVDGDALRVQGGEAVLVARQRAPAARAVPGRLDVDVEQHDGVVLERRAHPLGGDRAAAQREHRPRRRLEQLDDGVLLLLAERALAVGGEVRLDRGPDPLLDDVVGVDGAAAHRGRRGARGGGLPRAHEADEHQRAGRRAARRYSGRFHPIRSA